MPEKTDDRYLRPTFFMDYNTPNVHDFAVKHTENCSTEREKAIALYYAVRDGFLYNPYDLNLDKTGLQASNLVARTSGYCIEKSNLMAACARAVGIPSCLSFYDVRNHLATEKLERVLQSNVLAFHGAAEIFIDGQWLKVTPVFNASLCARLGVPTLEFDGTTDAIFQAYNDEGQPFMEYLRTYGTFDDIPYSLLIDTLCELYPQIVPALESNNWHLKLN